MLPLSPKNAALERVLSRVDAAEPPEAIVSALLEVASLQSAALDPTLLRAARTLVSLARDGGDARSALRALGAPASRPATRLALVAAVAEALDREPASPIGQVAVLAAIEALVAAPEPLGPEHVAVLLRGMLARLCERWLLSHLGRTADDALREGLSSRVRDAARRISFEDFDDRAPEPKVCDALTDLERALGGAR